MNCFGYNPYENEYVFNQAQDAQINQFLDSWDGSLPSSVNPNAPDDFFSGDGSDDRIDALCTAVQMYVYSYVIQWVNKASVALGVVAVLGIGASLTIVGGIIASVLVAGLAYVTTIALAAMQDTDAINDVICCMKNSMLGEAITQANFETSLDGCGFLVGSNQAIIRDIIASDLGNLSSFLTFINALGDAFVFAENGVSLCVCPECDPFVMVTFDDPSEYIVTQGVIDVSFGNPSPSLKTQDNGSFVQSLFSTPSKCSAFMTGLNLDIYPFGSTYVQYEILDQDDNSLTGGIIDMPPLVATTWQNINLPILVPQNVTGWRLRVYRSTASAVFYAVDNVVLY